MRLYSVQVVTRMAGNIHPRPEGDKLAPVPVAFPTMRIRSALLLWPFLLLAPRATAQVSVAAPGGTLRGIVQDSATGLPIGYALLVLASRNQRVFASELGRFTLTGLTSGRATLRVQQIGYRPATLTLAVDTHGEAAPTSPGLVIRLVQQPLVLPEIVVQGTSCSSMVELSAASGSGSTIFDEMFKNAERILTLEREYPFVLKFQRVVTFLDSTYTRLGGFVDTIRKESRKYAPYRAGQLLQRAGAAGEKVAAFTTSDIASPEFQKSHCFWYGGRDSIEGFTGYRIDFAPAPKITTIDWAGSLLVDSVSLGLLRAEARLVNIPPRGTNFLSAVCTIFYQPIVPSLPQEFQSRCVSAQKGGPPHIRVERWLLVDRTFLGKQPISPVEPR